MPIIVSSVTAQRQTLTIHYKDPSLGALAECAAEYDLEEYTAQVEGKNGRARFRNIRPSQWRAVCRDIFSSKQCKVKQMRQCIARYASAEAVRIFLDEYEKFALRYFKTACKSHRIKPEDIPEYVRRNQELIIEELKGYASQTLDEFADRFIGISRFTLDEFAFATAA